MQMINAMQDVDNGASKKSAAKKYGVPRATLIQKLKSRGRDVTLQANGRVRLFNDEEEDEIASRLIAVIDAGIVKNKEDLFQAVRNLSDQVKKEQVFERMRPSAKWLNSFMARHPQVKYSFDKQVMIIGYFNQK